MLYDVDSRIKIINAMDYLSNIDFHYIGWAADTNSFLQLLAEMVACRHYCIHADIVASLLIELFCGLLCFLQHPCKNDPLHLINSVTNYLQRKDDVGVEMIARINILLWHYDDYCC